MPERIDCDLCVVGAGSGGLSVAAGAAQLGARVVLVEKGEMGGECLNTGCVPSKSLLAAAEAAHNVRRAGDFGVVAGTPEVDFAAVHRHVHDVIGQIAPHDSQDRFERLGAIVLRAPGRFDGPDRLRAGDVVVRAKRFVIATGSRPFIPPVEGLAGLPFLTNETVFDLSERPAHLLVLGGGPVGVEMAQAFRRLGSRVTMIVRSRLLGRDDPEMVGPVRAALRAEGVDLREGVSPRRAAAAEDGVTLTLSDGTAVTGDRLLVAAGRVPNADNLGLEAAGVAWEPGGITVDTRLRTSNRRIFAIGDVTGGPRFTHMAAHQASAVVKNALFRLPAKVETRAIPRVTYTDPELAWVGLTEQAAREEAGRVEVLHAPLTGNDRARAERRTEGLAKVVLDRKGRVLGAGMVGARAGELLLPWVLAVRGKVSVRDLAEMIAPYPTLSEVTKAAAGRYYAERLFQGRTRALVRVLLRLP